MVFNGRIQQFYSNFIFIYSQNCLYRFDLYYKKHTKSDSWEQKSMLGLELFFALITLTLLKVFTNLICFSLLKMLAVFLS